MQWQQFWQKNSIAHWLLLPLSALYYVITTVRRCCYETGIFRTYQSPRPVVVVGNINTGGAGKTPLVIGLAKLLTAHNIPCAIVSKGYGGNFTEPTIVKKNSLAHTVGDEPLLIKLKCDCPVVVARSRIEACNIVADKFPETQVILTDDGLQHYQLGRALTLCVINSKIGLGNHYLLPAGGLREPASRLNTMDFVIHNGDDEQNYHYLLQSQEWQHISTKNSRHAHEFSLLKDDNLALSGIAHPQLFFDRVHASGIVCATQSLADHHHFQQSDLPNNKTLLMTEKDWVKVKALEHPDAWFLKTETHLSETLKRDFLQAIHKLL